MSVRDYVPIDVEELPEQFEFDMENDMYVLQINYNETADFFTVDLYTRNMLPLVIGEKMILNQPLWNDLSVEGLPALSLIPLDESGSAQRVSKNNLMKTVFLYIDDVPGEDEEGDTAII
ncbi:phage baseplate plug family protein [Shouchella lehensis]|uniref:Cyanophage baseplate Pam3 plug gp18 domain-containing protein n=1 Tax=Shouchella lehensis TaxID=300825 RepID=A0A4Y7WEN9_9BACI|nr:hypothetical protein [Shouchella lehensis]MBG9783590.1 hypothetical protein [Shouchella lehensis]TES45652.1 hypothetical protein E2L03_19920 [Shouchella lehensis]